MDSRIFFEREFVKFQDLVELLLIDEETAKANYELNKNLQNGWEAGYWNGQLEYIRSLINFIKNAKE